MMATWKHSELLKKSTMSTNFKSFGRLTYLQISCIFVNYETQKTKTSKPTKKLMCRREIFIGQILVLPFALEANLTLCMAMKRLL